MEAFSLITGLKLLAGSLPTMLDEADNPPLCENVLHNEIDCAHSSLPPEQWCKPCLDAYRKKEQCAR